MQSVEVALLDREIWQALTNAEPDVDALVAKILHRAELEYKFCTAGDADPASRHTRSLKTITRNLYRLSISTERQSIMNGSSAKFKNL